MCGVVAYYSKKASESELETLKAIIQQSKIRGLHAFGFAFLEKSTGEIKYEKHLCLKKTIREIEIEFLKRKGEEICFIFHNRYSTSGDFRVKTNNQPIISGKAALVFNGVIHMGKKEEYEKEFNETFETENDGEIMLKKIIKNDDSDFLFLKSMKGSYAGCHLFNGDLFVMRNEKRPLWFGQKKSNEAVFFASTQNIFLRTKTDWYILKETPALRKIRVNGISSIN